MGYFGGAAVNQALEANRAMLAKRNKTSISLVSSTNENWVDPKQPTTEQLLKIRTRIRKEEKERRVKTIVLTLIMIVFFCLGIAYMTNY